MFISYPKICNSWYILAFCQTFTDKPRKKSHILSQRYSDAVTARWQLEVSYPGTDMAPSLSVYRMWQVFIWLWSVVVMAKISASVANSFWSIWIFICSKHLSFVQSLFTEIHPVNYNPMGNVLTCGRGNEDITFACSKETIHWLFPQWFTEENISPIANWCFQWYKYQTCLGLKLIWHFNF